LPENSRENELDRLIIQTIESVNLENVQQLIDTVQAVSRRSKQEILDRILCLQQEERIRLKPPQTLTPERFTSYLGSTQARWYWLTVALTIVTVLVIFTVPEDAFPLTYLRYILGSIFVLWLPGHAFIKALFPQNLPLAHASARSLDTSEKNLDTIERIALSIGMSLALVPITGLLLNYTPWGIRLTPITLSLLVLTMAFATTALIREYRIQTQKAEP
jgi:hypothetical protein